MRGWIKLLATLLLIAATGCDKPPRIGDVNAIIVGMPDAEWAQIEGAVDTALEPRAFTVRNERIFRVTQTDPSDPRWNDFRRFTQLLLIGEPGDPWMTEAVDDIDGPLPQLPAVVNAGDVFARGSASDARPAAARFGAGSDPPAAANAAHAVPQQLRRLRAGAHVRERREYGAG